MTLTDLVVAVSLVGNEDPGLGSRMITMVSQNSGFNFTKTVSCRDTEMLSVWEEERKKLSSGVRKAGHAASRVASGRKLSFSVCSAKTSPMDWMLCPSKFTCWSPNPPVWLRREMRPLRKKSRLNEIIRAGCWSERIRVLTRGDIRELAFSVIWSKNQGKTIWTYNEKKARLGALTRNWMARMLILNFSSPDLGENTFCCFRQLVCGILLERPPKD